MLWALAKTLLFAWLACCALLYLLQRQLLFMPSGTRVAAERTDFALQHAGMVLRGWRVNPGQPRALLYFGGNAEDVGQNRERFAQWFPGHTIYLLAYRGYGASEGSPDEVALKADALVLHDAVSGAHEGVDLLSRSLGTGVALHLAARRTVGRIALITPYDSLVAVAARHYPWVPVTWFLHQRFEAVRDAPDIRAPVLLLIARQDEIIPPAHAQVLAAAFPQPPVIEWLDTDHNTVEADPRLTVALKRFF